MLRALGYESLDELTDTAVPSRIKMNRHLSLQEAQSEVDVLQRIKEIANKNQVINVFFYLNSFVQNFDRPFCICCYRTNTFILLYVPSYFCRYWDSIP